jgi:hypothetical protein
VLVIWRPDLHQYTAYVTKEVDASVPSTGGIINLDLPKIATQALGLSLGAWQADLKVSKAPSFSCAMCFGCMTAAAGCPCKDCRVPCTCGSELARACLLLSLQDLLSLAALLVILKSNIVVQ